MLSYTFLSLAVALTSMSTSVVARPGLGVVEAMSHLSARDLHDVALSHHHQSFARLRKRSRSDKTAPRRLARRGTEATLQCRGDYAFALCDGNHCTDMGSVAPGTMCKDNAITWDTANEVAPASTPASSAPEQAAAPSKVEEPAVTTTTAAPVVAAAFESIKVQNLHVVAASPSSSASEEQLTSDDEECDTEEDDWSDSQTSTGTPSSTQAPVAVQANVQVTTTAAPAATTTPAVSNTNSEEFTGGQATFFYQGGAYGACGIIHQDSDKIVALAMARYGSGSNDAPDCGRQVEITNTANGKTVVATVADACPGCSNYNSLDLSVGAFDAIGEQATGVLPIKWHFIS